MKLVKWLILLHFPFFIILIMMMCSSASLQTQGVAMASGGGNPNGDGGDMTCTYKADEIEFSKDTEKQRDKVKQQFPAYYVNMVLGIYETDEGSSIDSVIDTVKKYIEGDTDIDVPTMIQFYKYGSGYEKYLKENRLNHSLSTSRKYFEKELTKEAQKEDPESYKFYIAVLRKINKDCEELAVSGDWYSPLKKPYNITQDFGGEHRGIDYGQPVGTDLYAVTNAQVLNVGRSCDIYNGYLGEMCPGGSYEGAGNFVELKAITKDKKEIYIYYIHMAHVVVDIGDVVKGSQKIGTVGNSGNSTGSHLHLEFRDQRGLVWKPNGHEINPHTLINFY